jgi:integrase
MATIIDSNQTMRLALSRYCSQVSILKKGYAQEKYRIEQISRSFLGEKLVRSISSVDIATYRDQRLEDINPRTNKPLSNATVRLEMSLMSNFFDIARIEWGLCDDNPVKNVRKPKPAPGRDRRISAREERLILRYCHAHPNPELYSIFILAIETAMRQGEILKLRWEHINLKYRVAHLPETKNGSKRDVPLSNKARDVLIRLGVKSTGPVFSYTQNGLKSTWRFMMIKLGIVNLHFHDIRHEATSRLFELGTLDMMEIAAITGHKSLSMLRRYTHLKATKLARKLEGNKHKGKQAILDHLIPYPAFVENGDLVKIILLDFDDLVGEGQCRNSAIKVAQDALLRRIMTSMKEGIAIPQPDQYLETVDENLVVMIDPLPPEMA